MTQAASQILAGPMPSPGQIELILRQVESLPTLPTIATRLLSISNLDDADLDQIVEIIESDPTLTVRVLGLCRTAEKGLGDRITTVRRAVVMMGLEAVQAALLSVAVFEVMKRGKKRPPEPTVGGEHQVEFDHDNFWRHSLAVASAAELIAEGHVDLGVRPEEAFVAGLVHDIGKLSLEVILPKAYGRVLGLAERRQTGSAEAEQQLLGVDHHTVGRRLAEHWGLPDAVQDVIWLCGQPPEAISDRPGRNLIGIVWVARTLCRSLHLGWSGDFNHPEALKGARGVCRRVGLNAELVEGCVGRLHDAVSRRCGVLGLGEAASSDLLLQAITAANAKLGKLSLMFEGRSRTAQRQGRVLSAIAQFQNLLQHGRAGRGVVETLAAIARSASAALGPSFMGVVYRVREEDPWQLCRITAEGRPLPTVTIEAPGEPLHSGPPPLSSYAPAGVITGAGARTLAALAERLSHDQDLARAQFYPVLPVDASGWGSAYVMHELDASASLEPAILEPLLSCWSVALASAREHDGSRRLGERLAAANRSLMETQARLAEAQAMAKLGEFAAGAAHEMNNPLTVISGRAQLLADTAGSEADRAASGAIVDAAHRLSDLITSLRLIADPPKPRVQMEGLDVVIRSAVAAAQERSGSVGAGVRVRVPAPTPQVLLDRPMIASALAELIANAVQACPEGEVIVEAQVDEPDGRWMLVVTDRGAGMSERALQHAFDPFFSEKSAGRRTGLGLTRARTLVEAHGGEIRLRSRPGEGTTATILLPRDGPA